MSYDDAKLAVFAALTPKPGDRFEFRWKEAITEIEIGLVGEARVMLMGRAYDESEIVETASLHEFWEAVTNGTLIPIRRGEAACIRCADASAR